MTPSAFPDRPVGSSEPPSPPRDLALNPQNSASFRLMSRKAARCRMTSRDLVESRTNWTQIAQRRAISPVLARALQKCTDHTTQNEVEVVWRDRPF